MVRTTNLKPTTQGWMDRANSLIPGGSQTLSKSPSRFTHASEVPLIAKYANKCYITDIEDRRYLDFSMALGACVLGYNHPDVLAAVGSAISEGPLFTLPSYREAETAEAILKHIPWAEQVRFMKTGTDANTAAVRVARAYTSLTFILSHGYHGWADWAMIKPPALGVSDPLRGSYPLEYLSREGIPHCAAVVVEIAPNGQVTQDEIAWLRYLRSECDHTGTVLIFDEVLSGFRFRMGSAVPEVTPDLACFGKSIGNGYSISALVGKRDLMSLLDPGKAFVSGTSFGETTGLAACEATLKFMDRYNVPDYLEYIGSMLRDLCNEAMPGAFGTWIGSGARVVRASPWFEETNSYYQQECAKHRILFTGAHNMSWAHNESHVTQLANVYGEIYNRLKDKAPEDLLEAAPSSAPYRMQ